MFSSLCIFTLGTREEEVDRETLVLDGVNKSVLSDSNTNVNSTFNRRVSLFYLYPLEASHHMACPCTLYSSCVVFPGTGELVGQRCLALMQVGQL